MKRHIILVGLPGAGKTTVGQLVAAVLHAPFVDLDVAIERRTGRSISRLFAEDGEAAFRELERAEMDAVLSAPASVIAAGGGWAAQPGNLDAVAGHALSVYLRVPVEVAAQRVAPTADSRPLLAGEDVATSVRQLFTARRTFYDGCEATVSADSDDPGVVASEVVNLARSLAGWY